MLRIFGLKSKYIAKCNNSASFKDRSTIFSLISLKNYFLNFEKKFVENFDFLNFFFKNIDFFLKFWLKFFVLQNFFQIWFKAVKIIIFVKMVIKTSFWHCLGPLIIQKWQNNELSNRYYFFLKIKKLESFFKNENFGIFFDDFVWKLVVIDKNGAFLTSKCVLLAQIPLLKNIFFAVNRHLECTLCLTKFFLFFKFSSFIYRPQYAIEKQIWVSLAR